jgi:hypothetical protein
MVNRRITSLALAVGLRLSLAAGLRLSLAAGLRLSLAAGLRLSLAAGVGLSLAACGSVAHPGGSAFPGGAAGIPRQVAVAGPPAHRHGRCPQGRLMAAGVEAAVDYVDFLQLGGRSYLGVRVPVRASQLGPVIGHIRCSLAASEDPHRGPPPILDGTAAFLPAGAPVYEVRGYPSACRLAAYLDGRLQFYFAPADRTGQRIQFARCATQPAGRTAAGA